MREREEKTRGEREGRLERRGEEKRREEKRGHWIGEKRSEEKGSTLDS